MAKWRNRGKWLKGNGLGENGMHAMGILAKRGKWRGEIGRGETVVHSVILQ
jgi:hypothetical protein